MLELVIGGGGALYPYFLGWAQGLVNDLTVDEIDNLLFTKTGNSEIPLDIEIVGKKQPSKKVKKTSGEDNGGEKPKRAPRKKKSDNDTGVELN